MKLCRKGCKIHKFRTMTEAKEKDELEAGGLRLVQITTDAELPSINIYPEARVFTPDGRLFVLRRFREGKGELRLCDGKDGFSLMRVGDEPGATAPSVSSDGKYLYYIVDGMVSGEGRACLLHLELESMRKEEVLSVDAKEDGWGRIYPLSTISSDGSRLATGVFLRKRTLWAVLVFSVEKAEFWLPLEGKEICNPHILYNPSLDGEHKRELLVQENHGCEYEGEGRVTKLSGEGGADIHIIRDGGGERMDLPSGRDGVEFIQGHQLWRGEGGIVLSTLHNRSLGTGPVAEVRPKPTSWDAPHIGVLMKGAERWELARGGHPSFRHIACNQKGGKVVMDGFELVNGEMVSKIFISEIVGEGEGRRLEVVCPLECPSSWKGQAGHPHLFLSPDARRVFLNSDRGDVVQVWMVEGFRERR